VLNLFLALLLSSFGAESFQHSQEDSEPNKLQEAADRISRVVNLIRLRVVAVWREMQRQRKRSSLAQYHVDDSAVGPSFDAKLHPTSVIGPAAAAAAAASANTGAVNYNGPNVIVDVQPSGILPPVVCVKLHCDPQKNCHFTPEYKWQVFCCWSFTVYTSCTTGSRN